MEARGSSVNRMPVRVKFDVRDDDPVVLVKSEITRARLITSVQCCWLQKDKSVFTLGGHEHILHIR